MDGATSHRGSCSGDCIRYAASCNYQKQHQAEAAGYYEGGFTGPGDYRREAGVVHAGEFVANHKAVNNPQLLPALQLIDQAQRNNTVASLTATDVSRAVGGGNTAVVAPVVNVTTDNEELNRVIKTSLMWLTRLIQYSHLASMQMST